ncbi:cation channel sperm-associated protein 2-like [Saccostrea cucullata]|uniref:cation channel sperm-associated protein 2-like n=1 Tax=Saccostrea cuccullata TaxID=36930 RepID=UPI002ED1CBC1
MEENTQLTRQEAQEDTRDIMLPKDRALLFRKYKRILVITANLNKSKLHRSIREEVSTLMENSDIDLEKAISHVLNKHKLDFDELLEDITDDEESDEEYGDDEESDEEYSNDEDSDGESGEEEESDD